MKASSESPKLKSCGRDGCTNKGLRKCSRSGEGGYVDGDGDGDDDGDGDGDGEI